MKKVLLSFACFIYIFAINIQDAPKANRVDASNNQVILSYNNSIKKARQSVVNITATYKSQGSSKYFEEILDDPFFKHFFSIPNKENQINEMDKKIGSGVIISKDGYIITNSHVVLDATKIQVLIDSNEVPAKLIGADPKSDIAIIKVDMKDLNAIAFADSNEVLEGDVVFAIGNPFGVGETITQGIVSALNKNNIGLNDYENFIQTDAAINPGNSGGALVDSRGALIGINSAIITRGGGANGIGFAIPSNMAKQIANELINNGKIERGYLGVYLAQLNQDLKKTYNSQKGALVTQIDPNSAADIAGLKRGDLIIKVNDKEVSNVMDLKNHIGSCKPNDKIIIEFERDKKILKKEIVLKSDSKENNLSYDELGLELENLNIKAAQKLNVGENGVLVKNVKKDSKAQKAGIMIMDVIVGVEDSDVNNLEEFYEQMQKNKNKEYIKIWVKRNGITNVFVLK
ncbi:Do family serine endopeptidase [Campylobacter canadensis]|uniref:Do family serine endopeptidase n=1 Tax=Campylobacter canadensis TaxID=449520 RepID=UPI001CCA8273|nr:Do family serine endopeptidase [Campylobacter canadensis]MBZ7994796.1 Do family serine endopeptidase [Campylobacter canadensis]